MGLEIGKLILAFMVLINPFSALSIYLDMTRDFNTREKRKVAQIAAFSVFVVIAVFAVSGGFLLDVLGISVGSFQVGGGILVLLIAISMMSSGNNMAKPDVGTDKDSEIVVHATAKNLGAISVVPLAIPMMIGPGGISTVVIYASSAHSYRDIVSIVLAGAIISLICFASLLTASRVSRWLGDTGLTILNRIMGMLLAAVSVEIIVAGLRALFPQLAG